jgi:hypothetical protein
MLRLPLYPSHLITPPSGSSFVVPTMMSARLKLAGASVAPEPFVSSRRDSSHRTPWTLK